MPRNTHSGSAAAEYFGAPRRPSTPVSFMFFFSPPLSRLLALARFSAPLYPCSLSHSLSLCPVELFLSSPPPSLANTSPYRPHGNYWIDRRAIGLVFFLCIINSFDIYLCLSFFLSFRPSILSVGPSSFIHFLEVAWVAMRSSTTPGSASVEVSPRSPGVTSAPRVATLRRMRRMILPERVLGSPVGA